MIIDFIMNTFVEVFEILQETTLMQYGEIEISWVNFFLGMLIIHMFISFINMVIKGERVERKIERRRKKRIEDK